MRPVLPLEAAMLDHQRALFILVSFEGPDRYSQAGGLGIRVSGLAHALAEFDYETHLFFIGDPTLPPIDRQFDDRLVLHRWSQWISRNCPLGVYDGELGKCADLTASLPRHVIEHLILPAIAADRIPVLLFEEWQTAECACQIAQMLTTRGIRDRVLIAWNANHCYGFERIDWPRLSAAALITAVSRHMRSIVRSCGADARVIPNGIPSAALTPASRQDVSQLRAAVTPQPGTGMFFKMARWEREKGWSQALDAVSMLRRSERPFVLVARGGGPSGQGGELTRDASERGLRVISFDTEREFLGEMAESAEANADVVNLRFGVSSSLARSLYAASDGVLANSVSEPFGLVGLEAMAAGGVAYTSGTGEDYAIGGRNAVVLETLDPTEIVKRSQELASSPETVARIRRGARKTAKEYEWRSVVSLIVATLEGQARSQGLLPEADIDPEVPFEREVPLTVEVDDLVIPGDEPLPPESSATLVA